MLLPPPLGGLRRGLPTSSNAMLGRAAPFAARPPCLGSQLVILPTKELGVSSRTMSGWSCGELIVRRFCALWRSHHHQPSASLPRCADTGN